MGVFGDGFESCGTSQPFRVCKLVFLLLSAFQVSTAKSVGSGCIGFRFCPDILRSLLSVCGGTQVALSTLLIGIPRRFTPWLHAAPSSQLNFGAQILLGISFDLADF